MTIELLRGDAAASAASDTSLSGTLNPRAFRIGEATTRRAQDLLEAAFQNRWGAEVRLAEALSTSDLRLAASAELDREMLAQYEELPSVWASYCDLTTVRDFRPKRLMSRWSNTLGMPRVPELSEYPSDDGRGFAEYAIAVAKYGRRRAISWEAWLNNEAVQELQDMPTELARQARETEMIAAASNLLAVDPVTGKANGVNTAFFKAGNGNAPQTLPLTRDNLKTVLDGMKVKNDPNSGRKIAAPQLVLVAPKALETQVESIIRPTEVRRVEGAVTTVESNEFSSLDYVIDPMLDYVNTSNKAATTWFVVPKPGGRRPALWVAKLAGHEQPDLRVKADTGQRVGGGEISALEGSFEIDDIQYRCRHIVGNQAADALFTFASTGS